MPQRGEMLRKCGHCGHTYHLAGKCSWRTCECSEPYLTFTPMEIRVLAAYSAGNSAKEIAAAFGLHPKTIETHKSHMLSKAGTHKLVALIGFALKKKLITEADLAELPVTTNQAG